MCEHGASLSSKIGKEANSRRCIVGPGGCFQGLEEEESRDKRGLQAAEAAHWVGKAGSILGSWAVT